MAGGGGRRQPRARLIAPLTLTAAALLDHLGVPPFQPRAPWWGADLQTLRDTLRPERLPAESAQAVPLALPGGEALLGCLDAPAAGPDGSAASPHALVLLLHGLGGSSRSIGLLRLAHVLRQAGFAVLRLNLRGAGAGRSLARGTYAARCNRDLIPALRQARSLAAGRPLLGVGLSLGGTVLLNGLLDASAPGLLDGLVVVSSPIDLASSSAAIGRPRNRLYERWLLQRLRQQTLADPGGLQDGQRSQLQAVESIRAFDALITAPRWGFESVEAYYAGASPLWLLQGCLAGEPPARPLPPLLLVHALDDPWVPAAPAVALQERLTPASPLQIVLSQAGGHNGFHGPGGSWSDLLVTRWLLDQVQGSP